MTTQLDIFVPIAGEVKAKDQQDIMAFPCFSLSKKKRSGTAPVSWTLQKPPAVEGDSTRCLMPRRTYTPEFKREAAGASSPTSA